MSKLHHLALLCTDLFAQERFYTEVLQLEVERRWHHEDGRLRSVWLWMGHGQRLMLEQGTDDDESQGRGWHLVAFDMDAGARDTVSQRLMDCGVRIESTSEHSIYFRDPEGNRLAYSHWPR